MAYGRRHLDKKEPKCQHPDFPDPNKLQPGLYEYTCPHCGDYMKFTVQTKRVNGKVNNPAIPETSKELIIPETYGDKGE